MKKIKSVYIWVCLIDVLLLLVLGVMLMTGLPGRVLDVLVPGTDDTVIVWFGPGADWKQTATWLVLLGCPASVVVLWLGYAIFMRNDH